MRTVLIIGLALLPALAGCGEERMFDADGFVSAANDEGAAIELGEPLEDSSDGNPLYQLRVLEGPSATAPTPAGEASPHGGGTLKVTGGAGEAEDEYERCEEAVTLVCYRAANIAIYFEGLTPEERARIDQALTALAD